MQWEDKAGPLSKENENEIQFFSEDHYFTIGEAVEYFVKENLVAIILSLGSFIYLFIKVKRLIALTAYLGLQVFQGKASNLFCEQALQISQD